MTTSRSITPRSRLLAGLVVIAFAGGLSLGYHHYAIRGPLQTLAWFEQNRAPGDSLALASAQYHAAHARASLSRRWSATGYGTLGALGTLAGLALILPGRRRRTR